MCIVSIIIIFFFKNYHVILITFDDCAILLRLSNFQDKAAYFALERSTSAKQDQDNQRLDYLIHAVKMRVVCSKLHERYRAIFISTVIISLEKNTWTYTRIHIHVCVCSMEKPIHNLLLLKTISHI